MTNATLTERAREIAAEQVLPNINRERTGAAPIESVEIAERDGILSVSFNGGKPEHVALARLYGADDELVGDVLFDWLWHTGKEARL
jgi:hypothetical protein